jgi:hypothetical protein
MAVGEYIGNGNPDGTSFGRTATEKISFYGATPIVKPAPAVAVGTDIATVILEIADLRAKLVALGLIVS